MKTQRREKMSRVEIREFERTGWVRSSDGEHSELFVRGDRVRDVLHVGTDASFQPVTSDHPVRVYVMDWVGFDQATKAIKPRKDDGK